MLIKHILFTLNCFIIESQKIDTTTLLEQFKKQQQVNIGLGNNYAHISTQVENQKAIQYELLNPCINKVCRISFLIWKRSISSISFENTDSFFNFPMNQRRQFSLCFKAQFEGEITLQILNGPLETIKFQQDSIVYQLQQQLRKNSKILTYYQLILLDKVLYLVSSDGTFILNQSFNSDVTGFKATKGLIQDLVFSTSDDLSGLDIVLIFGKVNDNLLQDNKLQEGKSIFVQSEVQMDSSVPYFALYPTKAGDLFYFDGLEVELINNQNIPYLLTYLSDHTYNLKHLSCRNSPIKCHIDLGQQVGLSGYAYEDYYIGALNLTGSDFDDRLIGNQWNNSFIGLAGNDYMKGGQGYDTIEDDQDSFGVNVQALKNELYKGNQINKFFEIERFIDTVHDDVFNFEKASNPLGFHIYSSRGSDYIQGSSAAKSDLHLENRRNKLSGDIQNSYSGFLTEANSNSNIIIIRVNSLHLGPHADNILGLPHDENFYMPCNSASKFLDGRYAPATIYISSATDGVRINIIRSYEITMICKQKPQSPHTFQSIQGIFLTDFNDEVDLSEYSVQFLTVYPQGGSDIIKVNEKFNISYITLRTPIVLQAKPGYMEVKGVNKIDRINGAAMAVLFTKFSDTLLFTLDQKSFTFDALEGTDTLDLSGSNININLNDRVLKIANVELVVANFEIVKLSPQNDIVLINKERVNLFVGSYGQDIITAAASLINKIDYSHLISESVTMELNQPIVLEIYHLSQIYTQQLSNINEITLPTGRGSINLVKTLLRSLTLNLLNSQMDLDIKTKIQRQQNVKMIINIDQPSKLSIIITDPSCHNSEITLNIVQMSSISIQYSLDPAIYMKLGYIYESGQVVHQIYDSLGNVIFRIGYQFNIAYLEFKQTLFCFQVGYFRIEEPNSIKCLPCHHSCKTCSIADWEHCTECDQSKYRDLVGNKCICTSGYFEEQSNSICQKCDANCQKCTTTPYTCTECSSDQTINRQSKCECKEGYFANQQKLCLKKKISIECEVQCKLCRLQASNCYECHSANSALPTCTQCSSGNFLNALKTCEGISCDEKCQTCQSTKSNCLVCQQNKVLPNCDSCSNDNYFDGSQCKACPTQCQTCTNGGCIQCKFDVATPPICSCQEGQYFNELNQCEECSNVCITCSTKDRCITCIPGRSMPLCTCQLGYFEESGSRECSICSERCITCSQHHQCIACSSKRVNSPQCDCVQGFYENAVKQCQNCPSRCITCTSSSSDEIECMSCSQNRILPKCLCRHGFYEQNELCESKQNLTQKKPLECSTKCETCEYARDQCTKCSPNRSLLPSCNCTKGYFLNSSDNCQGDYITKKYPFSECLPNCSSCNEQFPCIQCLHDYLLDKGTCVTSCAEGYYSNSISCVKCNLEACSKCKAEDECTECTFKFLFNKTCHDSCDDGYFAAQNVCLKCHLQCVKCSGPTSQECTSCRVDQVLSQNECLDSCQAAHDECSVCSENNSSCYQQLDLLIKYSSSTDSDGAVKLTVLLYSQTNFANTNLTNTFNLSISANSTQLVKFSDTGMIIVDIVPQEVRPFYNLSLTLLNHTAFRDSKNISLNNKQANANYSKFFELQTVSFGSSQIIDQVVKLSEQLDNPDSWLIRLVQFLQSYKILNQILGCVQPLTQLILTNLIYPKYVYNFLRIFGLTQVDNLPTWDAQTMNLINQKDRIQFIDRQKFFMKEFIIESSIISILALIALIHFIIQYTRQKPAQLQEGSSHLQNFKLIYLFFFKNRIEKLFDYQYKHAYKSLQTSVLPIKLKYFQQKIFQSQIWKMLFYSMIVFIQQDVQYALNDSLMLILLCYFLYLELLHIYKVTRFIKTFVLPYQRGTSMIRILFHKQKGMINLTVQPLAQQEPYFLSDLSPSRLINLYFHQMTSLKKLIFAFAIVCIDSSVLTFKILLVNQLSFLIILFLLCPYKRTIKQICYLIEEISLSFALGYLLTCALIISNSNILELDNEQSQIYGEFAFSAFICLAIYTVVSYIYLIITIYELYLLVIWQQLVFKIKKYRVGKKLEQVYSITPTKLQEELVKYRMKVIEHNLLQRNLSRFEKACILLNFNRKHRLRQCLENLLFTCDCSMVNISDQKKLSKAKQVIVVNWSIYLFCFKKFVVIKDNWGDHISRRLQIRNTIEVEFEQQTFEFLKHLQYQLSFVTAEAIKKSGLQSNKNIVYFSIQQYLRLGQESTIDQQILIIMNWILKNGININEIFGEMNSFCIDKYHRQLLHFLINQKEQKSRRQSVFHKYKS